MPSTPLERIVRSTIAERDAGGTLLGYLTRRFTYLDDAAWAKMIAAGRLSINGEVSTAERSLIPDDQLLFDASGIPEPPVQRDYRILHQDDALLVVDKPPHLPVHPAGPYFRHTLWGMLREETGLESLHIITRLDRETSGLVLIALTPAAAHHCQQQLTEHILRKEYLALLEGDLNAPQLVTGLMRRGKTASGALYMELGEGETSAPGAKFAQTQLTPQRTNGEVTLVEAIPTTGRLHQIRVAASSIGHPIVGDKLYGPDPTIYDRFRTDAMTDHDRTLLRLDRQALHASGLQLPHPTAGTVLTFTAPLPVDMEVLAN